MVVDRHRRRWWSEDTVAIVTGANKGIGFAVAKRMAELGVRVILTARDKERGGKALEALRAQGLHSVVFSCLDVSDPASIKSFTLWFQKAYAVLDILVSFLYFHLNYFFFFFNITVELYTNLCYLLGLLTFTLSGLTT